jgi:hypothetical protein
MQMPVTLNGGTQNMDFEPYTLNPYFVFDENPNPNFLEGNPTKLRGMTGCPDADGSDPERRDAYEFMV